MKTRHTFIVHFWLKKNSIRKDGTVPIYARIRLDGKPADVSAKQSVSEEHWYAKAGRLNPKVRDSSHLNNLLDEITAEIKESYHELMEEGKFVTAQAIKLRYLGQDTRLRTLKDLLEYHQNYEIPKLAAGTAKNYISTERYLLMYLTEKLRSSDVYLNQINYDFITNFDCFLRSCKPLQKSRPLTNNGIMKHMERFKKMTNIALKLESIKKDPFAFYKANFRAYDSAFLTMAEIKAMETLSLLDKGMEKVRDIFVFACYTGLSYIDVKQLSSQHISLGIDGGYWIFTKREKGKIPVKVPLLDKAKEILAKYSELSYNIENELLLPVYSNQTFNKYLKRIAVKCGIRKNLSFHVARHTFATSITLANGVPIETVSKLLGHKKLSTTQIYARVMERKVSEDIADLREKLRVQEQRLNDAI